MNKFITITCYAYKGGELGTPECYNTVADLIANISDLLDLLSTPEYDFYERWPTDSILYDMVYDYIGCKISETYPSEEKPAFQIWQLNDDTNEMTELSDADSVMRLFGIETFKAILRMRLL